MSRVVLPKGGRGRQVSLKGSQQDFGKLGNISVLEHVQWSKIPTYYYDFRRFDLPLTDLEANREFGRNIQIFDNQGMDPGDARQTNAAIGTGVNEPFVALGTGIIAMGEGEGFTINGACVPDPGGQDNPTPFMSTLVNIADCYCGAVDLNDQPDTTRLATLWWGAPTWRFIEKFFQAYRLQITVNARFQLVDESLFDVGMAPLPPEFVGASDSRIPAMPFVNAVNNTMIQKDIGQQFVPANSTIFNIPDVITLSACLPPPLAEVTYGHPRIIGMANRIYCFNQPLVMVPGLRWEVDFFNVEDISVYTALRNSVTINTTTISDRFNSTVATPFGDINNCAINCTVPGGAISLGVVFKGYALYPSAVVDYFSNYLVPNTVYANTSTEAGTYLSGLLASKDYPLDTRNRIAGNLGMTPDQVSKR